MIKSPIILNIFFKKNDVIKEFEIYGVVKQAMLLTDATNKNNNIDVILDIKDDLLKCKGNEGELSQVFMNLLNNSKDALIENEISRRIIFIEINKNSEYIEIDLYDNANGINPDNISKVFEPNLKVQELDCS